MGYISNKYNIEPEKVVLMIKDGILDWKIEGLYEFWLFYQELYKDRDSKKEVREELMIHYNVKPRTFYRMLRKAKDIFSQ